MYPFQVTGAYITYRYIETIHEREREIYFLYTPLFDVYTYAEKGAHIDAPMGHFSQQYINRENISYILYKFTT